MFLSRRGAAAGTQRSGAGRAAAAGGCCRRVAGRGSLTAVAYGAAGWVAFGDSPAGPTAATSADGITWHLAASLGAGETISGAAGGPDGYVAVGRRSRPGG